MSKNYIADDLLDEIAKYVNPKHLLEILFHGLEGEEFSQAISRTYEALHEIEVEALQVEIEKKFPILKERVPIVVTLKGDTRVFRLTDWRSLKYEYLNLHPLMSFPDLAHPYGDRIHVYKLSEKWCVETFLHRFYLKDILRGEYPS